MKNLEKCVDWIAELVGHFVDCQKCPCHNDCLIYDNECSCKEFFKRWAMKEDEESQEATSDIEHMLNELNRYCHSFAICAQNGWECALYSYCRTHADFETKDVESLYERMKKRMEKDGD